MNDQHGNKIIAHLNHMFEQCYHSQGQHTLFQVQTMFLKHNVVCAPTWAGRRGVIMAGHSVRPVIPAQPALHKIMWMHMKRAFKAGARLRHCSPKVWKQLMVTVGMRRPGELRAEGLQGALGSLRSRGDEPERVVKPGVICGDATLVGVTRADPARA
eukprot:scaffold157956_cov22-Tisochrysis_lutea.AAC.1